ncbi:MAG: carbohydrate kinase family protein [Anaerolineales bacterium]
MHANCDVIVAGHVCLDILPDLSAIPQVEWDSLFRPGSLLSVGPVHFAPGGVVSNTGLTLHKLGSATRLVGKIGDDPFGREIRQIMESYGTGLADDMLVDEAVSTSYTIIINPPGIDRIFLHCPGANDSFSAEDLGDDLLQQGRLLHFGYPPVMERMYVDRGAQLVQILRRAKTLGLTTSLDMTLPDPSSSGGQVDWAAILKAAGPYTDIFVPSIEETLYMLRRRTYDELTRVDGISARISAPLLTELSGQLLDLGVKVVGFKLGDRGLYLRTGGRAEMESMGAAGPHDPDAWADKELWSPCFQVDVVGTTGAGDATIAGLLSGLLRGLSAEEALVAAVAVGACNVEAADALSGILAWDETMQRVAAGWSRRSLSIDAPGWRFDSQSQIWIGPEVV